MANVRKKGLKPRSIFFQSSDPCQVLADDRGQLRDSPAQPSVEEHGTRRKRQESFRQRRKAGLVTNSILFC